MRPWSLRMVPAAWAPALVLALTLICAPAAAAQSFTYAEDCLTNVDNATVHVPPSVSLQLPSGDAVAAGDTVAVYTAEGRCAGHGVWSDSDGVTLAAAGPNAVDASTSGFASGEPLKFEVFDVSTGSAADVGTSASFAPCDGDMPICRDDGAYATDTFHEVASFDAATGTASTLTRSITTTDGWNLLSVPVEAPEPSFGATLPTCASGFFFSNSTGYASIRTGDPVAPGRGGFFKCAADTTSVSGQAAAPTVEVSAGWNIIGAFEDTVAVSAITSSPAGIVESDFFGLSRGYEPATKLYPGEGYWVKVQEAGTLDLSGASGPALARSGGSAAGGGRSSAVATARLILTDATGQTATLALQRGLSDDERERHALPPVPPRELFDVRFETGYGAAALSPDGGTGARGAAHGIQVQGAAFPLDVRLETEGDVPPIRLASSRQDVTLSADQPAATLTQATARMTVEAAPPVQAFSLGKSRPNPLRSEAKLEYTLPEEADVSIALYDLLGRRVAQLVRRTQRPGTHQARVDGRSLSSGVYFVRMSAGSFQETRRLTVVK